MKFKTFTVSLKVVTISFLGTVILSPEAKAASIKFGNWIFNPVSVTKSSEVTGAAGGSGSAAPNTLEAQVGVSIIPLSPSTWGTETATTLVSLSNFFTVEASQGEKVGDKVEGFLSVQLEGALYGIGFDFAELTGSFDTTVEANVDAGFQSFTKSDSHSGSILLLDVTKKTVSIPLTKIAGILTVGEKYPFNMSLTVSSSKTGAYQAISKFDSFTANVEAVPEPITILAAGASLGFGALFKKTYSRKHEKPKA